MLLESKWGQVDLFKVGSKWYFVPAFNGHPIGDAVGPFRPRQQAVNAILTGEGWDYRGKVWDHIPDEGRDGRGIRKPSKEERKERTTIDLGWAVDAANKQEWWQDAAIGSRVRVVPLRRKE